MFLCAKEAIKRMKKQQSDVVLFTASTNGLEGHPLYADYNASKAGVILLAKTLALEFAPWLRVNAVCPGYVLTPMQKAEYTPEMLETVNSEIPLNRHAAPEEIAGLFAFLSSEEALYMTEK
jgi:NAD(P)-dependent dehydrogenase (short-subunit alcohol dehydrogenase family)